MAATRILVADDERGILHTCRRILEHAGYEVATAADGNQALNLLKASRYDLLLVDLKMPGLCGMDTVSLAHALDPALMIIMFTAYATLETAVEAVKRGAFDYLAKPFTADQLCLAVERALRQKQLMEENLTLREQLASQLGFDRILGTSRPMQKLFGLLQKVVRSNANILILGETGTGKDLVARTIHAHSSRWGKPFVAVDCASLPENLMESELFGHEKGAFTGADRVSRGQLELAHTGTLFLDEIAELSLTLQAKLLRTLQERELRRLGGEKTISVDIRVISATSRDLPAEIANRTFRQDLYYRLNTITAQLPPLRDRDSDILLLANNFLRNFSNEYHLVPVRFSPEVTKTFCRYSWPGNVRELQNVVQHAVLVAEGDMIGICDLPDYLQSESPEDLSFHGIREKQAESVEKPFLEGLLRRHKGNISEAAAEARMTRKTIYRLAKKFDIDFDQFRQP
ncbi:MAG: sigma-54 dependent transcriptional regulator [Acidobacteriota bacterium]